MEIKWKREKKYEEMNEIQLGDIGMKRKKIITMHELKLKMVVHK